MVLATSLFLYYLVQWRPFLSKLDLSLNIFSSALLLVLYLLCFLFSVLSSSQRMRSTLGYILIVLVLLLFVINVLTILVSKIVACAQHCAKRRKKRLWPERESEQKKLETGGISLRMKEITNYSTVSGLQNRDFFASPQRKRVALSMAVETSKPDYRAEENSLVGEIEGIARGRRKSGEQAL